MCTLKKKCLICNTYFETSIYYKQKKYCSIECYAKTMRGTVKNSFWETASKENQIERLRNSFEKYVIRNEEGCWSWKGTPSKKYGSLQYGGKYKTISAHRASWLIHYGEIPEGMFICHYCDNPRCSRPDHLFLGTPTDNVHDMHRKGRAIITRGEDSFHSILTTDQVTEIKELLKTSLTMTAIAKIFNVHIVTIHDIKYKKTWAHLPD
jgi:hypothetical protein